MRRIRQRLSLLLGVVWVALVAGGMAVLSQYKERPGVPAKAPATWPLESRIQRAPNKPTLVMLAHPRCPCTRASLAELARLTSKLGSRASAHVLFIRPPGTPQGWEQSDLWEQARAIPGVEILLDPEAGEARRFGGATSGQVLLYGADGRLQFEGGITPARGHEGDSPGADRIYALVTGGKAELAQAPVFGCPLHDPTQQGEPQ